MDLEVLRIAREIAPLWPKFLDAAREKPEMAMMLRMCGIVDPNDESDTNSIDELFGSGDDSLASTLGQSGMFLVGVLDKITEGASDDEILASMSNESTEILKRFLNKDLVMQGLETVTGIPVGVELYQFLLIQQFTARQDWLGLLDFLDSIWIHERNTPQNELPVEKLVLVGRWHLLCGLSEQHLLRVQASYDEYLKALVTALSGSGAMQQENYGRRIF